MSMSPSYESMTVMDLIRSLAATEDALRVCPSRRPDGTLDPRRREILHDQAEIRSGLRQRRRELAARRVSAVAPQPPVR